LEALLSALGTARVDFLPLVRFSKDAKMKIEELVLTSEVVEDREKGYFGKRTH
jgi:hypothetical protein